MKKLRQVNKTFWKKKKITRNVYYLEFKSLSNQGLFKVVYNTLIKQPNMLLKQLNTLPK